jgi:hypothetical protein
VLDDPHVAEQIGDGARMRLAFDLVEQDRETAVEMLLQAGDPRSG